VRGEILTSERSLKMRKSPTSFELIFFQGLTIDDFGFTIGAANKFWFSQPTRKS
jgi:hypothetical protein